MPVFREGSNRLWTAFVTIYLLAAIGLDLHWLFTRSGLVGWLAMLQARVPGNRWYPKFSFMILLLAELVPVILLKLLIERVTGTRLTAPPEGAASRFTGHN